MASQVTYRVAEYILKRDSDRVLTLDGRPFSRRVQVEEVAALAHRAGQPLHVIHCWAPDAVVERRLQVDLQNAKNLAAGRTERKILAYQGYLRATRDAAPLSQYGTTDGTVGDQVLDYVGARTV